MSIVSIVINTCSATLYDEEGSAIGAHAGNSKSIDNWIAKTISERGYECVSVSGYKRLEALKNNELNAKKKEF
jgi:hypothetical protein